MPKVKHKDATRTEEEPRSPIAEMIVLQTDGEILRAPSDLNTATHEVLVTGSALLSLAMHDARRWPVWLDLAQEQWRVVFVAFDDQIIFAQRAHAAEAPSRAAFIEKVRRITHGDD